MQKRIVRACLITNPRSGRGGIDLSPVLPVLEAHGWEVAVRQKLRGGYATKLAREAAEQGFDVVVACGGDGTVSEIVDGLAGTSVAMGAIPGGTVNLWTREIGVARRLEVAALQLVGAQRRRVDLGHVTVNGRHGRYFLLMAGLGLDGAIMARVSKPLKNRIGPLAVGVAAAQALPGFKPVPVRVTIDEVHWQGRIAQIIVGNTRQYGGFTRLTPDAYVDDGLLDLCLLTATGPLEAARQMAALLLKQQPSAASAELYRAASITVSAPVVLPLQVDGGAERISEKPEADGVTYRFTVASQALTVLTPRLYDGALFQMGPADESPLALALPAPRDEGAERETGHHKERRRLVRVVDSGVDTITVVRPDDGKVRTLVIGPQTVTEDAEGTSQPIAVFLANLREGDLLRLKGKKDAGHRRITARKVRLMRE